MRQRAARRDNIFRGNADSVLDHNAKAAIDCTPPLGWEKPNGGLDQAARPVVVQEVTFGIGYEEVAALTQSPAEQPES